MFWGADIRRAEYDPETISMLTTVLERALAALPRQDQTEERKTRLASSILGAAARGERDPLLLYATALVGGDRGGPCLPAHQVHLGSNIAPSIDLGALVESQLAPVGPFIGRGSRSGRLCLFAYAYLGSE